MNISPLVSADTTFITHYVHHIVNTPKDNLFTQHLSYYPCNLLK